MLLHKVHVARPPYDARYKLLVADFEDLRSAAQLGMPWPRGVYVRTKVVEETWCVVLKPEVAFACPVSAQLRRAAQRVYQTEGLE